MTDERIDIEITDGVSPNVAKSIRDIADAAIAADSAVMKLKRDLASLDTSAVEKLANASARVTNAAARQTTATAQLQRATASQQISSVKLATAQQNLATATARTATANSQSAAAAARATTATAQQQLVTTRLAAAQQRAAAATSAAAQAQATANRVRQQGNAISRQSQQQIQNLVYQLNDIGVSLASGQKPLTVLIQQGSQISTIFGPGRGVLGTFRALGAALATIFLPLLPVIAVLASVGLGFVALQHEINKTAGVAVTFGDTFMAVFQVIWSGIKNLLAPAVSSIGPYFEAAYNSVVKVTQLVINQFIGAWVGAINGIIAAWRLFPAALKDIFVMAANACLSVIEKLVNGSIKGLNAVLQLANEASNALGQGDIFSSVGEIDLSGLKGQVTGAAAEVGETFAREFDKAASRNYTGEFFKAVSTQARKNALKRLEEEEKKKGKGRKTKETTFADVIRPLQEEIAQLKLLDQARRNLIAVQKAEDALKRKLTAGEKERLVSLQTELDLLRKQDEVFQKIRGPLVEYKETLGALNALYEAGKISIEAYNDALGKTQLATDLRSVDAALPGQFSDNAALQEIQLQQQERLKIVQDAQAARIISEEEAAARIREINTQLYVDLNNLQAAQKSLILNNAEDTFNSLAQVAEGFAGKQSGIYKAMFLTAKAFAVADAIIKIQQGIANALALPFPANLAAVASTAAAAASIVSTIQSVQFAAQGKKDGGIIRGPGGPRDDKVPTWLSNGEFVVNAAATRRNRPLLEALNDNRAGSGRRLASGTPSRSPRGSVGNGMKVTVNNYGTSKDFEVQQISPEEIRIIARDEAKTVVRKEAPKVVAADMNNANSATSKAISRNTNSSRRRV